MSGAGEVVCEGTRGREREELSERGKEGKARAESEGKEVKEGT